MQHHHADADDDDSFIRVPPSAEFQNHFSRKKVRYYASNFIIFYLTYHSVLQKKSWNTKERKEGRIMPSAQNLLSELWLLIEVALVPSINKNNLQRISHDFYLIVTLKSHQTSISAVTKRTKIGKKSAPLQHPFTSFFHLLLVKRIITCYFLHSPLYSFLFLLAETKMAKLVNKFLTSKCI